MAIDTQGTCAMISVTFVSRSLIQPRDRLRVLDDILTCSIDRNSKSGVTGLLIASPGYFAQLVEGPLPSVEAVMASIRADPRHTEVHIVRQTSIEQATAAHWRMVRLDAENFGHSIIDPLMKAAHAGDSAKAVDRLEQLFKHSLAALHANSPSAPSTRNPC